jgi:putative redox protein
MRVDLQSCDVNAKTETTTNYPSIFVEVQLEYRITGTGISNEQALKAVRLSMTKYCGVSAMVAESAPMVYDVFLNGENIGTGRADFKGTVE